MTNALYTDLSSYYDLLCCDIDYSAQSHWVRRIHQLFGDECKTHLDLACGTGPHIPYFIDFGYKCQGLDINQPMLDIAQQRCPQAHFIQSSMSQFELARPVDLITCFLYSLHYCQSLTILEDCIKCVHAALNIGGLFCFNAVNKDTIDNRKSETHFATHNASQFRFSSSWYYAGAGNTQSLLLQIEKTDPQQQQTFADEHTMVALNFSTLQDMLRPYFEVHVFENDYTKIEPLKQQSGNAIFVCIKI